MTEEKQFRFYYVKIKTKITSGVKTHTKKNNDNKRVKKTQHHRNACVYCAWMNQNGVQLREFLNVPTLHILSLSLTKWNEFNGAIKMF